MTEDELMRYKVSYWKMRCVLAEKMVNDYENALAPPVSKDLCSYKDFKADPTDEGWQGNPEEIKVQE